MLFVFITLVVVALMSCLPYELPSRVGVYEPEMIIRLFLFGLGSPLFSLGALAAPSARKIGLISPQSACKEWVRYWRLHSSSLHQQPHLLLSPTL